MQITNGHKPDCPVAQCSIRGCTCAPVQPPADREPTDAVDFKSGEVDVEALRKSAAPADEQEFEK